MEWLDKIVNGLTSDLIIVWCVLAVIFVFVVSLFMVVSGFLNGLSATGGYLKSLEGLSPENLVEKRKDVFESINEKNRPLWNEFDESLVNDGEGRRRLGNTLDAIHFFNMGSVAPVFENNRFIKATPGLLTGIGVLGTFLGLWFGLKGIDVGSSDPVELRNGINAMINGASAAFLTSIVGVFFSLLFNVIEKSSESIVHRKLTKLCNRIDFLYPRITSEDSLSKIDRTLEKSHIEMSKLAEKIGNSMQEVMSDATESMIKAIIEGLSGVTPAMEKLTNGAAESSEKAFELLMEKFLDVVGTAGQDQQVLMKESSELLANSIGTVTHDLREAMAKISTDIGSLSVAQTSAFNSTAATLSETASEVKSTISLAGQEQVNNSKEATAGFTDAADSIASQMQKMSEQFTEVMNTADAREQERLQGTTEAITRVNNNQQIAADQLLTVRDSFNELIKAHDSAAREMMLTVEQLGGVASTFSTTSSSLQDASSVLGKDIKSATTLALNVVEESKTVTAQLAELPEAFDRVTASLAQTSGDLSGTVSEAKESLELIRNSLEYYQDSLIKHVGDIETKMAELLNEYADMTSTQVRDRMAEWDTQTSTYTDNMQNAIIALSAVVDEMDRTTKQKASF